MRYVSDLHIGRINPKHLQFDLDRRGQEVRPGPVRARQTADGVRCVGGDRVKSSRQFKTYRRTEEALVRYTELARSDDGEKLPVPAKAIDPGQPYAGVPRLVRFLKLVGDLPPDFQAPDSDTYDASIAEGVKRFQRRHGLDDDGRLGPSTVKQLNVPLADRVRQLQAHAGTLALAADGILGAADHREHSRFPLARARREQQDRSRDGRGGRKGDANADARSSRAI